MSVESMAKAYEPAAVEAKWYPLWEQRGYFKGDPDSDKTPYTIVIPPPNVTGVLTLGHVLNNTLQDILIRFEKMRGREICWVPGTDHAGIATQAKVEKFLQETEGLSRYDLGREDFLTRVWEWKEQYGGKIIQQLRTLGTACDWERERFTLDEGLSNAVQDVFVTLYEKGLIYRGHRIINWCPKSRTALSDEEVIHKEKKGKLWHFRYPLTDGSGHVTVATTRPETMLGDTAVAVHPDDERYTGMKGKTILLPIVNREIPIIFDDYVDKEFGTGAVKVTPAHDPNDYDMGMRHELPMITVMGDDGAMNADAGADFQGMDRFVCRKAVVAKMDELGLLEKIEDHQHQVGYSERGDVPVEPRLSEQWFVKVKPLAEPALDAVESGKITFHPARWVKTYRHWMENIRDWCISRQLWWGHRIPAYYCAGCGETVVAKSMPAACPKCHTHEFHQDEDVLDTWFSSWLWPFSVFDWPTETKELDKFYPTDSLVTGPDIIFFWVARMIMAGIEFMGDIPFKDVYFTSIIRDEQGRKLSKSLNNSPDPLEVIATYGADALRFTMIYISPTGQDLRYSNEKCEIGRNFANKLYNAARFRAYHGDRTDQWDDLSDLGRSDLRPDDRWILARLNTAVQGATTALTGFHFHEMCHSLYEFVWNEFCDWYLESAKAVLNGDDDRARGTVLRVFDHTFSRILRLLHPVMPFITEELYHNLGFAGDEETVMRAAWPVPLAAEQAAAMGADEEIVSQVASKFDLIRNIRNVRSTYQIPPNQKIKVILVPADENAAAFLQEDPASLAALMTASEVTIATNYESSGSTGTAVGDLATAYLPLAGVVDIDAEKKRLRKQEAELLAFIEKAGKKLSNEKFVTNAPEKVIQLERDRLADLREKIARIRGRLESLA
ncbi:MAG: valine--tRNA ligase [Lentisphaeria bacterium]|nr:valine--tRNA ligase [Lentisphaeria bacterium]